MKCPACGAFTRLSKAIGSDNADHEQREPRDCPECGADLSKAKANGVDSSRSRLRKGI